MKRPIFWPIALVALLLLLGIGAVTVSLEKERRQDVWRNAAEMTGGDPKQGRAALARYGCIGCHVIPGVKRADGLVGPPLDRMANRLYVGGVLTNTPENMMRWIVDPQRIDEKTAMPNTGVTETDARHITAYLYTLK